MTGKRRADVDDTLDVKVDDEQFAKLKEITNRITRVEIGLERQSAQRLEKEYASRREVLKGIEKFWPVALMNNDSISTFMQHPDDQKAVSHLTDLWIERDPVEHRAFTIEFHFSENPYFSDKVIKKVYKYNAPPGASDEKADENGVTEAMVDFDWSRDIDAEATKINWKDASKNLVKLHPRVIEEDEVVEEGSFFNYFETADDHSDLGLVLVGEFFPEAIAYFTGEARDGDDSEEESEEEEDDEADEIDLEKPKAKKLKKA